MDKSNKMDIEFVKMLMELKEDNKCEYYRVLGMIKGFLIAQNYYNNKELNSQNEEM